MRVLALVLAVSATALADVPSMPRPPPITPMPSCRADTDCVITTFQGCCGSCTPREPRATSKESLELQQRRCASIECDLPKCAPSFEPPPRPVSAFSAVCRAGQCERVETPRTGDLDTCFASTECTLSSFRCCGGCCPGEPHATTLARLKAEQEVCARKECEAPRCASVKCAPPRPSLDVIAACVSGRCQRQVASPPPPPEGACRADADCELLEAGASPDAPCRRSPCGCCPGAFRAAPVSRAKVVPLVRPEPRPTTPPGTPSFGLSEGTTRSAPRPPPVNCGPCPAPRPARAACQASRCVLVTPER